jgi:signal transduction histidine kinase
MAAALERADEVLVSGRDRVRELRTKRGEELSAALVTIAEAAAESSRAAFRLTVEGVPRPLHPIVAEEFAAIGREAIHNAFEHADASNIDAVLTYDRRALSLRIVDDGRGLDANILAAGGREGHFGLTGMRERAEKIEAKFQVSSRPGAGCEIAVTAPARVAYTSSPEEGPLLQRLRALSRSLALLFGAKRPT